MLAELAVELLQPLLMAKIINDGVMKQDFYVVATWGSIMVLFSLLAFGAGILNTYFASHASQCFGYDIRKSLFRKIQSFSYSQYSLFPTGSLMTRLTNDVQQLQNTVFMMLRIMARAPLLIIGGLLMSFIVHPKLALFLAVVVPILFLFLLWIKKRGRKMFNVVQNKLDQVNNVMGENLDGMKLIRAFRRSDYEVNRFNQASDKLKKRTASVLRLMEVTMPTLLLLMNITIVCILWYGHQELVLGSANVGEIVAIVNYSTRITSSLSVFSFIIVAFSRAQASAQRINDVLQTTNQMEDSKHSFYAKINGEVSFNHVGFHYEGVDTWVLKDISFTVKSGQTVAILGGTGSGKSTLMNLIPRLYDTSEGAIFIDGVNIREYKQQDLRNQIGIVSQESMLFTGTVKDNILWGKRDATDDEIIAACKDAQIYTFVERLSEGLHTVIGQKGVNLSGGQRQRLSIARALIRKPSILLFDDSTSALDVRTEKQLLRALRNYKSTKIIVTQKISTARNADLILLLEDGKKVAEGTHEHLSKTSMLYQEILQSQLEERMNQNVMETTK